MVINTQEVSVISKAEGCEELKVVVANGFFVRANDMAHVDVKAEVDAASKFKNVSLFLVNPSSGKLLSPLPSIYLLFKNVVVKGKQLKADKFGKVKMSMNLPADCVVGLKNLGVHIFKKLHQQSKKVCDEARTVVYNNKTEEQFWIYVDYDDKDKYIAPTIWPETEMTVETMNTEMKEHETADITLKVQTYLWENESGFLDYSVKFKLQHAKFIL